MRVAIIGGTGHIGSYLAPRLFDASHTVICVSRGLKTPYREHAAWYGVQRVETDRTVEEAAGTFGERIAKLDAEVVIDLDADGELLSFERSQVWEAGFIETAAMPSYRETLDPNHLADLVAYLASLHGALGP